MTIVAMSRGMGSGGYEIGAALAKTLHFEYVERQILLQAANAHGARRRRSWRWGSADSPSGSASM